MPDYGRIDDRSAFKEFISSTADAMKKGTLQGGEKEIESAFEALAKSTNLERPNKTIQGSELGVKEAKALFKLTKKFIETHDDVTVSDSLLANMNAVKEKYENKLGRKFLRLENQIIDKATIEYADGKSDLKAQLEKELKDHAKEVNDLRKAYRAKNIKYALIGGGSFIGITAGLALTVITGGAALFVGIGLLVLGLGGGFLTISKGGTSAVGKSFEYENAVRLQDARMKAFELLNDEKKLNDFCKWHQIAPDNVTINELIHAYPSENQFSVAGMPEVSNEFKELNRSYHFMSTRVYVGNGRYESAKSFVTRFQDCGLKEDPVKLHFVRYLDHTSRPYYNIPIQTQYWRYQRLLEVQKELQPNTQGMSLKEEYELLLKTNPRNNWQEFRVLTLQRMKRLREDYKEFIERYALSEEFKAQQEKDKGELKVNEKAYNEYACLLRVFDRYPDAGPYHLARLNELREQLKLA